MYVVKPRRIIEHIVFFNAKLHHLSFTIPKVFLTQIELQNFKNYESLQLNFCEGIQGIVGENGSGKTNLLDAIYYLALSKSAFNAIDQQNIKHEESYFTLKGNFQSVQDPSQTVFCGLQKGQKKILKLNGKQYDKISEHIGRFPVVMIAPQDQELILEGSETRRRLLDNLLCQLDATYLDNLVQYNRFLQQRNALLKQFYEQQRWDKDLLLSYDRGILHFGKLIFEQRRGFVEDFLPIFKKHYQYLSEGKESTRIAYKADFAEENYLDNFYKAHEKDRILQRTTLGTHRDDLVFQIDDFPLKKFGSQGQQKSFLVALKLAQFEIMHQQKGIKPILLLDDIFDKLDDRRMKKLIEMVASHTFGQIFLTDARPERTLQTLSTLSIERQLIEMKRGALLRQVSVE